MGREDEIKLIAYCIWEEEGYPDGRDYEHWTRAEAICDEKQKSKTEAKSSKIESTRAVKSGVKVMTSRKKS